MSESQKEPTINCGCGCFGILVAIASFILICWIGGCDWARGVVKRCVGDMSSAISNGGNAKSNN